MSPRRSRAANSVGLSDLSDEFAGLSWAPRFISEAARTTKTGVVLRFMVVILRYLIGLVSVGFSRFVSHDTSQPRGILFFQSSQQQCRLRLGEMIQ